MYTKDDPKSIQEMFNSIAKRYDKGNAVLSLQMHRLWNRKLRQTVLAPGGPLTILDLCCGTGDIALGFLRDKSPLQHAVYMLDFSAEMLACARQKAIHMGLEKHNITYLEADAQAIPLPDQSIDRVTVAYGIRNVRDRARCFAEIARVMRPGGIFGILELTRPKNSILRFGHSLYLKTMLPLLGRAITANEEAYKYLCNSIASFVTPETIADQLQAAGFAKTTITPLSGGVATLITATTELRK
jgi:demethylmenaquinone methyltransferase/2-methoxy-6-polyprenyl-1,4-benzoquinol methylase